MKATNISIKQQSIVSINVETLQAIKQRVLQAIKQHCNADATCRMGLRAANWMDRVASDHPTLFNIVLGLLGIFLAYQVLNYNFTTSI